jgi:hypothetical protein
MKKQRRGSRERVFKHRPCALLLLLGTSACTSVIHLPPRQTPSAILPDVALPSSPPEEGMGRLIVDAVDGSMRLAIIPSSATARLDANQKWCITPCVRDLPYGQYDLYFAALSRRSHGDTTVVNLGRGTTVVRFAPGVHRPASEFQLFPDLLGAAGGLLLLGSLGVGLTSGAHAVSPAVLSLGGAALLYDLLVRRYADEEQADATIRFALPDGTGTGVP